MFYIVGQINPDNRFEWSFEGVFDSQQLAEKACKNENYFVGATELNQELSFTTRDWDSAYYPKAK